jgi:RNA polymerase sigma factor (sigma-70 family)
MLARFFVQNRPSWQKQILIPDLEGEGFLALTKAARTYDKKKLPYPKAYFARAIMNAMYKSIRKTTRQPGNWKISLQEAADLLPILESPDYLNLAIDDLDESDQGLARDRFQGGQTLRTIAEGHCISLRSASVRSRTLARTLAEALDIRLSPHAPDTGRRSRGTSPENSSGASASGHPRGRGRGR